MSVARFGLAVLFIIAPCAVRLQVRAQGNDPFRPQPAPPDPFGPQPAPRGQPVRLTFRVLDEANRPIDGAAIRVPFAGGVATDEHGKAILTLTARQLRQAAVGQSTVKFTVFPPRDRLMAKTFVRQSIQQLLAEPTLDLRLRDGVKLFGQVIGQSDKRPVKHVRIYVASSTYADTLRSNYVTETNEQGRWSMVIPKVNSTVAAVGHLAGYRISRDRPYTKDVQVVGLKHPIEVSTIEIEQLPKRTVLVVADGDEPMVGASVQGWYEHWLSDKHVQREQLTSHEMTGGDGTCQLRMHDLEWTKGFVRAECMIEGVPHSGRVRLHPGPSTEWITITLRRPVKVSGRLVRGKEPAADVEVVILELLPVEDERKSIYIARRGEVKTDARGGYEFNVASGLPYAIAYYDDQLQEIHRIPVIRTSDPIQLPVIDLRTGSTD